MPQTEEITTLKSARIWDIKCPPPANSTSSAIIQSTLGQFKTVPRRISVEMYQVSPSYMSSKDKIVHAIQYGLKNKKETFLKTVLKNKGLAGMSKEVLRDDEICLVRFYDPVEYAENPVGIDKLSKYAGNVGKTISASIANIQKGAMITVEGKQRQSTKSRLKRFVSRGRKARGEIDDSKEDDGNVEDDSSVNNEESFYNGAFVASEYGKGFGKSENMRMGAMHDVSWIERYSLPLSGIIIHDIRDNLCVVSLNPGEDRWIYEFIFDTALEAASFARLIMHQKKLETSRAHSHLSMLSKKLRKSTTETVNLLIEIPSAWDLFGSDANALSVIGLGEGATSDPYVVVRLNHKEIHRTKVLPSNLQPIWGFITGSLFIVQTTLSELLLNNASGVQFEVRDSDAVGYDDSLGAALVSPKELIEMNGERREFVLTSLGCRQSYSGKWCKGYMSIRCRCVGDDDVRYFQSLKAMHRSNHKMQKVGLITEGSDGAKDSGQNLVSGLVIKNKKVIIEDTSREKKMVYRVRPRPNKPHASFREWMTHEEINNTVYEKSSHWIEGGTGNLGEIYLEIIGCDNLPNKDFGFNNKTDTIVSCIYRDVVVQTDVVYDCLSPRFMPWTQRAFLFHISHPSDLIHVGIFDYDETSNVEVLNFSSDRIGQLVIGISDFKPNTEYVLNYNIVKDESFADKRKYNGSVTLRLRIEWADERQALLSSAIPTNIQRINLEKRNTFKMARWTVDKECDNGSYSVKTITSYIDELYQYQNVLFDIQDAFETVILWRGTYHVHWPIKIQLPLHSLVALILLGYLIESPEFFPTFLLLSLAWLLIAVNAKRRRHPSPILRPYSFFEYLMILIGLRQKSHPLTVLSNENGVEWKAIEDASAARIKRELKTAEQRLLEMTTKKREEEVLVGENLDISTKLFTTQHVLGTVDPLKYWLYPWQILLRDICHALRIVRNVLMWENAFFSFWLTLVSLLLAFLSFFIPWGKIFRWGARVFVYTIFGPWMKLVDKYYVTKLRNLSLNEKVERELEKKSKQNLWRQLVANRKRKENEKLIRLRDFRVVQFGIYLVQVPRFNMSRVISRPTSKSSATPVVEEKVTLAEKALEESGKNKTVVCGQSMEMSLNRGDMLLRPEPALLTIARTGEPIRNINGLIDVIPYKNDTRLTASLKISFLIGVAFISSLYGVPIIVYIIKAMRDVALSSIDILGDASISGIFVSTSTTMIRLKTYLNEACTFVQQYASATGFFTAANHVVDFFVDSVNIIQIYLTTTINDVVSVLLHLSDEILINFESASLRWKSGFDQFVYELVR